MRKLFLRWVGQEKPTTHLAECQGKPLPVPTCSSNGQEKQTVMQNTRKPAQQDSKQSTIFPQCHPKIDPIVFSNSNTKCQILDESFPASHPGQYPESQILPLCQVPQPQSFTVHTWPHKNKRIQVSKTTYVDIIFRTPWIFCVPLNKFLPKTSLVSTTKQPFLWGFPCHLERIAVHYFLYLFFINSQQPSQITLIGILASCIMNLQKLKKPQWKTGGPNFTHYFGT